MVNGNSTLADVIPTVTAIVMSLADMPDAGMGTVKDKLLSDVRSGFEHMESESLYAVAKLVSDTRIVFFKTRGSNSLAVGRSFEVLYR